MRILVGVPTFDRVAPECFQSVYGMKVPQGFTVDIRYVTGYGPAQARNKIANQAIDEGFDYVLYVDSDQAAPVDTLEKLTKLQQPITAGWAVMAFGSMDTNIAYLKKIDSNPHGYYSFLKLPDVPTDKMLVADAVGFACTMISTEVFKNLNYPYFQYVEYADRSTLSEDLYFCNAATKAGYAVLCDTSLQLGHVKSVRI